MKRSAFLVSLLISIIVSCNTSPNTTGSLNEDNLTLQEYTIDITRDTVLATKNGAFLKIPKGALTSKEGNTVTLEIKEAYSMQHMIKAGLITQADGEPLSSGGMIYISAKAGQSVKITQPIKVATPTNYLADGMQLYKGQKDENGNINWQRPTPILENDQSPGIREGQVLFQAKCASCHAIGKDVTGPNLAHFPKRFPGEEGALRRSHFHFLHYYPGCSGSDASDSYSWAVKSMFGSLGPLFPDLHGVELDNIYRYIQNESDKNDLPLPSHAYLKDCIDSCCRYNETVFYFQKKKEGIHAIKDGMIRDNGGMVKEEKNSLPPVITNDPVDKAIDTTPPLPVEEKVSPVDYDAEYYQFSIESFGWFNIDMMVKDINGVEDSELFVRITGEYRKKIKVYLIIPSVKVYVEGGPAERNKEDFAFYLENGKIPLPQNRKAYIMAVTETETSIAFALKEFTTSLKQEFELALAASTKEAFITAIDGLHINGLNIKAEEAKNAAAIRKINTEIKDIDKALKVAEYLKPKNCNCDGNPKKSRD